jgi:hypothetical protein
MNYKFFLFITFFITNLSFSQDIITKRTGEDIKAKIIEVGISEIKYKKFDFQDSPIYSLSKQEVLIIRYQNGSKDIFNQETFTANSSSINSSSTNNSSNDLYLQGEKDANKYYKGYKSAQTGTLITGVVLSPLLGLVPAIATSNTDPLDSNLNYPNSELMKKTDYYNGYINNAKKIKTRKVWTSWFVALGIDVIALIAISQ